MVQFAVVDHLPSSQTTMAPLSFLKPEKAEINNLHSKKTLGSQFLAGYLKQKKSLADKSIFFVVLLIKARKIHQASQPTF